jgi:hypothetical protein
LRDRTDREKTRTNLPRRERENMDVRQELL